MSVDPAELRNEAQHRLRRWAGHDESLIFAADFGDLVDQLVQAGTRGLAEADEQGQVAPEGPLGLLAEAALLVRCKALSLAGKGDTPASRSVLKHAGFIALTVALRQPDAVPESLHLAVALAASSWSADLLAQVQGAGRTGLLDEAVDSARLALRMGAGLRQPPGRRTLATALAMRFERSGEQADIDAAVLLYRQLAGPQEEQEAGPHGGPAGGRPVPPDVLHNLGVALRTRFEFLGETADLDDAVQALTRAVAAAAGSPQHAGYATSLAAACLARFERDGQPDDLAVAVTGLRAAIAATSPGDPALGSRLSSLGTALRAQYEETGQASYLDEAAEVHLAASQAVADDHPQAPGIRMNLGNTLRARFELTGSTADLSRAIEVTAAALETSPRDYPARPRLLSNLGAMLRLRFQHAGDLGDLAAAISLHRQAVEVSGPADPYRPRYFSNLSTALISRYDSGGDRADLDGAVEVGRRATAGGGGPPDRARCLSTLANGLMARFERLGAESDLDEAVATMRSAVGLLAEGNVDRTRYLANLGVALQNRFQRTENEDDLQEAIQVARQARRESAPDAPAVRARMSNLAGALQLKFKFDGSLTALNEAISLLEGALDGQRGDEPTVSLRRSNLGMALLHRFERTGDPRDLSRAVECTGAALSAAGLTQPAGDSDAGDTTARSAVIGPSEARSLINFGSALEAHGRQADTGATADVSLNRAAEAWRLAATATTAATPDRIVAAALWGRLSAQRGRWAEAADAYAHAAAALDTLAWHGIGRGDHEYLLQGWHDLARDASACAIGDDRITAAVELLDAGRGVLWSRQLELRADLSGLDRAAPSLAADLRRVRAALDTPATVAR